MKRDIESKELEVRPGKKQFEIFSTDFTFDMTLENVHVMEVSHLLCKGFALALLFMD